MIVRTVACLAAAVASAATLSGADLPGDISPEARAVVLRRMADGYIKARDEWRGKAEDARTLTKFPATAKEGKAALATAEKALARLDEVPWRTPGAGLVVIGEKEDLKAGDVGIVSPLGEYVATKTDGGTQIDGLINPTTEKLVVRFLIASPFEHPKPAKGKKAAPPDLAGLWYVAGFVDSNGKAVPVVYKFPVNKGDVPTQKK